MALKKKMIYKIEVYDAELRELDGQVGIWWQIDPKTEDMEMWSPYVSNYDNPIRYTDPLGDQGEACCKVLDDVINWIGEKASVAKENAINNLDVIVTWAKDTWNQAGENARNNWEARNDFFHQTLDNPMSLMAGPVGELNVLNGVARTESTLLRADLNTVVKSEANIIKAEANVVKAEANTIQKSTNPITGHTNHG
jgi:hypothetical protein